jgi:hypothetical protein
MLPTQAPSQPRTSRQGRPKGGQCPRLPSFAAPHAGVTGRVGARHAGVPCSVTRLRVPGGGVGHGAVQCGPELPLRLEPSVMRVCRRTDPCVQHRKSSDGQAWVL